MQCVPRYTSASSKVHSNSTSVRLKGITAALQACLCVHLVLLMLKLVHHTWIADLELLVRTKDRCVDVC